MSDYSFMQSGFGDNNSNINMMEELQVMLSLFISRAMGHAARYSKICNRNGVTKEDMIYALKYEVFEFFSNPNLQNDLLEIKQECLEEEESDEYSEEESEEYSEDKYVVPDEEVEDFSRVDIETVDTKDKEFVNNIHNYYDRWDNWEPSTPMEETLKNAIEKTYC